MGFFIYYYSELAKSRNMTCTQWSEKKTHEEGALRIGDLANGTSLREGAHDPGYSSALVHAESRSAGRECPRQEKIVMGVHVSARAQAMEQTIPNNSFEDALHVIGTRGCLKFS